MGGAFCIGILENNGLSGETKVRYRRAGICRRQIDGEADRLRGAVRSARTFAFSGTIFLKASFTEVFCYVYQDFHKVRLFASSEIQSRQNYRTFTIKIDTKNPLRRLSHKGSKRVAF